MCDDTAKYERGQKRQRDDKTVEKAVVAFPHTVPHPRAVVIKSLWPEKEHNREKEFKKKTSLVMLP